MRLNVLCHAFCILYFVLLINHAALFYLAYHDDEAPAIDITEIEGCNTEYDRRMVALSKTILYASTVVLFRLEHTCFYVYTVYCKHVLYMTSVRNSS